MQPDRAIVFDLDDTLYPYRRFQTSGWLAVAAHLEATTGLDARLAASALLSSSRSAARGREIETCLDRYDLPAALGPSLAEVFDHHLPRLRRTSGVTRALVGLRAMGWRVGVLTNGQPTIQARKVAALGLEPFLDAIEYAATSSIQGKPHPDAFAAIARRLGVVASRVVLVGNDEHRDVRGAIAAGMHAIRCDAWGARPEATAACARLVRFADLPMLASVVLRDRGVRRAA